MEYGEKTENHGKWDTHTVGSVIMVRNIIKREKIEMHTVGPRVWRENWKIMENEKDTL